MEKIEDVELTRYLTKREIRNELFGLLAMTNGFATVGQAGGERQKEMIKYLPKQIASKIMDLQDLIEICQLES